MAQPIEVKVPDIGDFKDVDVVEVLVKPGDRVEQEQSLLTLESDKATMEIPSSHAGVVKQLRTKVGDKVSQGSVIVLLVWVLLMENSRRGLFFGKKAPIGQEINRAARKYHGYLCS